MSQVMENIRRHNGVTGLVAERDSPGRTGAGRPALRRANQRCTGAQALIRALEEIGVDTVFGIPGGAVLPLYDALFDSPSIQHILVRHEQAAGHAAAGYAQVTGRPGVCLATSGPGATNLVTAIADAYRDSVPMVAITGQVPSAAIGTDAFQEIDIYGITMPITKHNFLVTDANKIVDIIAAAFHIAGTGRPGPVLVDITKDALTANTTFSWPPRTRLPGYRPATRPSPERIRVAAQMLVRARRPVLYVGGGVLKARATSELRTLAELTNIPVTTTLMARGAFPDSHRQHLGMPGMHGTVAAVAALQKADLIVALGARFDDRVTGRLDSFAPHAKIVHADIDPAEMSKNRHADVPIVGDVREVLAALIVAVRGESDGRGTPARVDWWQRLDKLRESYPLGYRVPTDGSLSPQLVIERIGQRAPADTIFVSGVGQHQMWASQFIRHEQPHAWVNSGGAGTMGYAVPAAMGAKAGRPDAPVWVIDGDGCFQMTCQELTTCVLNRIPIKVAIINNGVLGMVRQWQTLFYDKRYSNTSLTGPGDNRKRVDQSGRSSTAGPSLPSFDQSAQPSLRLLSESENGIPDFVLLAEAMGAVGLRCTDPADVDTVLAKANSVTDRPVVVDFVVRDDAMVWPMVAAGAGNDDLMIDRDVRPDFSDAESR